MTCIVDGKNGVSTSECVEMRMKMSGANDIVTVGSVTGQGEKDS